MSAQVIPDGLGMPPEDSTELARIPAHVWPRNTVRGEDGVVRIAGVALTDLAAEFGTPLFVIDEDDFRSRCREMAEAFGGAERVHYASKAFLCGEIARWVDEEGLSLDVASGGELAVALNAGFPAGRVTVHGNNKTPEELRHAVAAGVAHIVIDSLQEIDRLDAVAREAGIVQDVFVRVTTGVEAHTHEFISTAHEDQKFGFSLAGGAAMEAVTRILATDNLRLTGLHSHIGSQIFETDGFELAAHRIIRFLAEIVARFGEEKTARIDHVDLGGGIGIAYTEADTAPPIAEIAASLRRIVADEAAEAGLPLPTLVVEPGRAIAGPGTITLYEVGTLKDIALSGGNGRRYISVDGGMSDNIRTSLYDATYDCRVVSAIRGGDAVVSRVVGKHCESGDIIIRDVWMPDELEAGDLLGVAATGAYCYSMSSRYNLQRRPAVVAVRDGAARLILRRETYDDLMSLEIR